MSPATIVQVAEAGIDIVIIGIAVSVAVGILFAVLRWAAS